MTTDHPTAPFAHEHLAGDDLAEQLDTWGPHVADVYDPPEDDEPERTAGAWRITSADEAEWAAGKLAEAHAELDALAAQRDEWQARLEAWWADASAGATRTAAFMSGHLEGYALAQRRAGTGTQVKVPSATVSTRQSPRRHEYPADEQPLVEWAEAVAPEALRQTIARSELNKALVIVDDAWVRADTGELIHDPELELVDEGPDEGQLVSLVDTATGEVLQPDEVVHYAQLVVHEPTSQALPWLTVRPARVTASVKVNR